MGARKKYIVGRYLKGALEADVKGLEIGSNNISGIEMTGLQESEELTLLVSSKLDKEDIFKLWIIKRFDTLDNYGLTPDVDIKGLLDKNQVQFLYLKEIRNFNTPLGKHCYSRLVFHSLNDRLSDTGYSIANYVQLARPGEGYAWPRLKILPEREVPEEQQLNYQEDPNFILKKKRPTARFYLSDGPENLYICVVVDP